MLTISIKAYCVNVVVNIKKTYLLKQIHALRGKCPYSELFWSVFPRIRTGYGQILPISPHSVQMPENADQNNSKYGHFLCSIVFPYLCLQERIVLKSMLKSLK